MKRSNASLHAAGVDDPVESDEIFGFWLYLMSDAILFGLIFATYAVMVNNTAGGPAGNEIFSLPKLSVQTAVLLASTLTVAFACQAAIAHRGSHAFFWLALTCMLGIGFLGLEIRELARLVLSGAGPGHSGFLSAFFTLVGTHGMHVFAGVIWGITLLSQLVVKGTPQPVVSRLQRLTLFWHFLDIVWIGVFSIAYLPGITG